MSFRNFERGNICRKSRERAGKSVEAAAGFVEVSSRMIHQYESGDSEVPEAKLLKMAECYGDPLLPYNYWAMTSEIAKHYGFRPFEEGKTIFSAAIEAGNGFNVISRDREDFMVIMEDGNIESHEKGKYSETVGASKKSFMAVLFLDALLNRKEKTALSQAV